MASASTEVGMSMNNNVPNWRNAWNNEKILTLILMGEISVYVTRMRSFLDSLVLLCFQSAFNILMGLRDIGTQRPVILYACLILGFYLFFRITE